MGTPHLDLLDRLKFEDLDLHRSAFLSIHPFADIAEARKAILHFIKDGLVELYLPESPTALAPDEAVWRLRGDAPWADGTSYMLRITRRVWNGLGEESLEGLC